MRWDNKLVIAKFFLILFVIFLLASFLTRDYEWLTKFFMAMSETALSVVIIMEIVERVIQRENEKRWEKVKSMTYSEILDKLRKIALVIISSDPIGKNKNIIESIQLLKCENTGKHASSMRNIAKIAQYNLKSNDINKSLDYNNKSMRDIFKTPPNTAIKEVLSRIDSEIEEYKFRLVPRVLDLSDDEEVNLALMFFEKRYVNFAELCNSVERENITLKGLAELLIAIADLYEVVQRKMHNEPQRSLIEEIVRSIEHWWLPYEY
jgi:hypothetical protein